MAAHVCPENSFSERRLILLYRENARTSCSSTAPNTIAHFLRLTGGMCIIFYERKKFSLHDSCVSSRRSKMWETWKRARRKGIESLVPLWVFCRARNVINILRRCCSRNALTSTFSTLLLFSLAPKKTSKHAFEDDVRNIRRAQQRILMICI